MLKPGEFLQTQLKDGLNLRRRQPIVAIANAVLLFQLIGAAGIFAGSLEHGTYFTERPTAGDQVFFGFLRRRRRLDRGNHLVDIRDRYRKTFQHMTALTRFAQQVHSAPRYHLTAVANKVLQQLLEVENARLIVHQGDNIDAKNILQLRLCIQIIQHHLTAFAALHFNHNAQAVFVRLVAQLGNTFNFFVFYQLCNFLDQARLVDLVGQLGNDDGVFVGFFIADYFSARAHINPTAAGSVGIYNARSTVDDRRRWEVRPWNMLHQFINRDVGIVQQRQTAVNHFGQVVGGDIRRHTNGDTRGTIDQQTGNFSGQYGRDLFSTVVVRHPVDRFFIEVGKHLMGDFLHANLGITHCRRVITVNRAEVTLTIHQHIPHGKWLRHADNRVVNRRVAVWVVLTDHVTNDTSRFLIRFVPVVAQLAHREQHPTVHRFEAIAHIGQGAPNNYAHCIVEVGLFQLILDIYRQNFICIVSHE